MGGGIMFYILHHMLFNVSNTTTMTASQIITLKSQLMITPDTADELWQKFAISAACSGVATPTNRTCWTQSWMIVDYLTHKM